MGDFDNFGFRGCMIDCSRNAVMNVNSVKAWIDVSADLGYNMLMLYTEDTYEIKNRPYFGYCRGRYTVGELSEINSYAVKKGIELIPCIQTLAHLNQITRWQVFSEYIDQKDILLVGDERVYNLIDDMFLSLSQSYTSKYVHVGMDEAKGMGHGKYYDLHGGCDIAEMFVEHITKVAKIAEKYGKTICVWGDMFHTLMGTGKHDDLPENFDRTIVEKIPDNVEIVCWEYTSTSEEYYDGRIKSHNRIKNGSWFAGGLRSWWGFTPHNAYTIKAATASMSACIKNGVKNILFTVWGDDGAECSKFSLLPSLFYASELMKNNFNEDDIKAKFEAKFGVAFDDFMLLDLPYSPNGLDEGLYNSDKYLLYNDVFMGILDSTLIGNENEGFSKCAEALHKFEYNKQWGYIFRSQACLCDVLSIKADLGVRTRKAYNAKDKTELKKLTEDYDLLCDRIDIFYEAFRNLWYTENKGQGFEVQDIRLGGLKQRIRHCKYMLEEYISGSCEKIDELEETLLDYKGGGTEFEHKPIAEQLWARSSSTNLLAQTL